MSTRANIVIKDSHDTLYFYRHSDGYPEETGKDLKDFVKGFKNQFRDNVGQSAGWLIVRGHLDMAKQNEAMAVKYNMDLKSIYGWKVGHYEPTTCIHGDIDYLYEINLKDRNLKTYRVGSKKKELIEQTDF